MRFQWERFYLKEWLLGEFFFFKFVTQCLFVLRASNLGEISPYMSATISSSWDNLFENNAIKFVGANET